ncbi:Glycosyltransferase involved in cell wall bisynthesis [Desulfacinum infernum DSM 9756]|uniref:Glycosyltransferase involved in cell wall bisynthesis n=1 Tax=Desulfacinum infernum DSM 9756 TaxID=1121391 RepID=A0A1M4YC14_9BACT|nr:glycosyltransferase [Desulfacinum infernum]SHF03148.1 Glycosyltransferase involved in cell wall bisynthesis [Desulfacinum infernum DSM 9756]
MKEARSAALPARQAAERPRADSAAPGRTGVLGMILKGYPRISESFISTEILLLESLGVPIQIFSLRQPRESFTHRSVQKIKAPVTYMPEYVLPHFRTLMTSNLQLWRRLGARYARCLAGAIARAAERKKTATLRHFLQAGHLSRLRLLDGTVTHLHAHFCHTPTSVALFASELTGLPFSFTAHAKDIYTSEPEQLRRKIHRARFVVTCTRYNADYLRRIAGRPVPIHTIYHGIDLDFFDFGTDPPPAPPYRLLSVGRMVPKKGYDDLLAALRILADEGLDFTLDHIGSGDEKEKIEALCRRLGLDHRVRFRGTLPHEQVIGYYRRSHAFVLACKVARDGDRDGIPNVLVEAMAVGLPVISTRVSAIPELVEDGVTGTLVDPGNPGRMARAIRKVLTAADGTAAQVRAARRKVEADFDNRRCVQRLYELFRQALAQP